MQFRELKNLVDTLPALSGVTLKDLMGNWLRYDDRTLKHYRSTADELVLIQAVRQLKKRGVNVALEGLSSAAGGSAGYHRVYGAIWSTPVLKSREEEEENNV